MSLSATRVAAQVRIEELSLTREFKHVAVELRGGGPEWRAQPDGVRVVVRGPRRLVADFELPAGAVHAQAPADASAEQAVAVVVDLPDRLQLMAVEPSQVKVVTKRPARGRRQ